MRFDAGKGPVQKLRYLFVTACSEELLLFLRPKFVCGMLQRDSPLEPLLSDTCAASAEQGRYFFIGSGAKHLDLLLRPWPMLGMCIGNV